MPRDQRMYMTFPIDIHRHPKLARLAPEVRWTFVEMNGEARIAENDGVFKKAEAEFMWPIEHLDALVNSHPQRPLLKRTKNAYFIRDYAEHQLTRSDREELSRKRREAGAKGGQAFAEQLLRKQEQAGEQTRAGSESGLKLDRQTDVTTDSPPVTKVNARAEADEDEFIQSEAKTVGIKNLSRIQTALARVVPGIEPADAIDLTRAVLELSKSHVRSVEAYIETAVINSPHEVKARWDAIK